jgi:hypothetical protein
MPARPAITDSPWFWAYLFGVAALMALALAGPKFGPRQAQIEREYQGRTRAAQNLNGVEPDLEMSTAERTLVTLSPLFMILAAVTMVCWGFFWWQWRTRTAARISTDEPEASSFRDP